MAKVTPLPGKAATPPDPTPLAPTVKVRVRAIQDGYYGEKLRRSGDVFVVEGRPGDHDDQSDPTLPHTYSHKWMEVVPGSTPERQSTSSDVLRQQHDEELAHKLAERSGGGDETPPKVSDDDLI